MRKKQNKKEPDQKSKNEPQHQAKKKTEKGTPKKPRPSIIVAGDSMIKNKRVANVKEKNKCVRTHSQEQQLKTWNFF